MKKCLCVLLTLVMAMCFCIGGMTAASAEELTGTIHLLAGGVEALGLKACFAEYQKTHPGVDLDFVNVENVTDFETIMTTDIAANTMPDIYCAQVSAVQMQYAREGYLMDLGKAGLMDQLVDGDTSLIKYDGWFYTFPMTTAVSVTLCNKSVLDSLGIELTYDNYPKTMDEFIDLLQAVREKGIEYPFGIAGADSSSCTAWPFQYIYQVLYGDDPDYYAHILTGEKQWDGEEFRNMFAAYDRIREYVSPDSTGKTNDGLYADFIMGNTVFFSQVGGTVKTIQQLDPDTEIILIPSSFTVTPEKQTLISGFDSGISITTSAENPDLCIDFVKYCTSPEGSTLFYNASGLVPTTKANNSDVDSSYDIILKIMQDGSLPNSPIRSRQWIAGFKELLKNGCQNWLAGESVDSVVKTISEHHTRLMEADPEWVNNFLSTYEWVNK